MFLRLSVALLSTYTLMKPSTFLCYHIYFIYFVQPCCTCKCSSMRLTSFLSYIPACLSRSCGLKLLQKGRAGPKPHRGIPQRSRCI